MNSLRFGRPEESRNRFLLHGVVAGISAYGNCIGVPDVGGEIVFDDSYADNPLVNAMCVGLIEDGRILSASARSPGDLLILVGADTGRDGIHGASGLASRTFEEEQEMMSAVQVGNPFLEKVLIEACLEAVQLGLRSRNARPGRGRTGKRSDRDGESQRNGSEVGRGEGAAP